MRGLLLRLSALDPDAATAVRVISFFDALVEGNATVEALVRATSGLAECGCGMRFGEGKQWRFAPNGTELGGSADHLSGEAEFTVDDISGTIWLERSDAVAPLDGLVLERASLAARILLSEQRRTRPVAGVADPALVEVILSRHEALADRSRALRHLGLVPEQPLRVVAVQMDAAGCDPVVDAVALIALARPVGPTRVGVVGGLAVVLVQQSATSESPASEFRSALRSHSHEQRLRSGVHIGIGAKVGASDAEASWQQALMALRFTRPASARASASDPREAVVDYDELGVLALLADIPPERLSRDPQVAALDAFGATPNGDVDIATLEAYCQNGSLRRTARVLYLHHSTVSARLARIEEVMGWDLDDPAERFRAQFALWARRLVHAPTPSS